ncbi:MAG: hypothetical protein ACTS6P_00885 [Candidatus Hodgkinia cicadicola]
MTTTLSNELYALARVNNIINNASVFVQHARFTLLDLGSSLVSLPYPMTNDNFIEGICFANAPSEQTNFECRTPKNEVMLVLCDSITDTLLTIGGSTNLQNPSWHE